MLRVLLLDDEEDALDLLEILLGKIGSVQVIGRYTDPFQAVQVIEEASVDLVFLDIDMPGMKGTQVARRLKDINPKLRIVFTTAYSEYAVEAFEIQTNDYLLKPITLERLQLTISRFKKHDVAPLHYIQCMGGFFLYDDKSLALPWKTNKEKEVCAFLIHHLDQPLNTDVIIEAIWPDYDVKKARSYLYTCLSYLRKKLIEHRYPAKVNKFGKGFVFTLDDFETDEEKLRELFLEINVKEKLNSELYHQLITLYKGEYMAGCGYHWALPAQMELRNLYIQALRRFYENFKVSNITIAEECLRRVLTIIPDSEKDARDLMKLYMESGKRSEAKNIYRLIEQAVHDLGVELESDTVRLYKEMNLSLYR
ncbi:response regulator [Bacillus sp. FJAT-49711]|uniref:response regulator n=1 Tax=Bacillus sp. FJAT-49711 TaxID=2833585 RepID=UPI001BC9E8F4|nr:response regulator [Bacillus sp. FJAT-49711]MBS4219171.1 response regulator [Bacillus sp. FJAT-49711]